MEFLAAGTSPSGIVGFQPSTTAKARVADLLAREKTTGLSEEERGELDHFVELEHIMRLAKARARRHMGHE